MIPVIFALVPVFAAIALGNLLRRLKFLPDEGWAAFDRVNYYVFFPALIIHAIGTAQFEGQTVLRMGGVLLAAIAAIAGGLLFFRPTLRITAPAFTSLFQCSIRWNGFVALAASLTLFGPEGLSLVAIGMAVVVPTVNVLSVLVLTHSSGTLTSARRIGRLLGTNPLIVACAVGILLNVTGIGLPGPTADFAQILGRAALALGLLSVGAGLDLSLARTAKGTVALGTGLKLLFMPALVLIFSVLIGLEGLPLQVVMLIATVPTATSGYVLARQLGGDAPLMAGLVTSTSLLAILTMPVWLALVS